MPRWPVRARSAIHLGLGAIAARFVTLLGDFNARGPDLLFALLNHVNCATPVDSGLYSLAGCCISNQRRRLILELRARIHTYNSVGWTSERERRSLESFDWERKGVTVEHNGIDESRVLQQQLLRKWCENQVEHHPFLCLNMRVFLFLSRYPLSMLAMKRDCYFLLLFCRDREDNSICSFNAKQNP